MMYLNLQDIGCILSIIIFVLFCFCISGWFIYLEISRIKQRLNEDEEAIKACWDNLTELEERFRKITF